MKNIYDNLQTFTKRAVALILVTSLVDIQLSYILAFLGKEEIAESLSSTIANVIIGVMVGYFCKALFESYFENRETRLMTQINKSKEIKIENNPREKLFDEWDDEDVDQR